jgi:hypothetical protein
MYALAVTSATVMMIGSMSMNLVSVCRKGPGLFIGANRRSIQAEEDTELKL